MTDHDDQADVTLSAYAPDPRELDEEVADELTPAPAARRPASR
jgi:hypothetical protein